MGTSRQRGDGRAVAPVVGIVLVVGLTILLAGTVLAFTLAIEQDPPTRDAPTAAFGFDFDSPAGGSDALAILHRRGDAVDPAKLAVDVDGARCAGGADDPNQRLNVATDWSFAGDFTAGQTVRLEDPLPPGGTTTLCSSGDLDLSGATVRLVWSSGVGTTRQLQVWQGPGA